MSIQEQSMLRDLLKAINGQPINPNGEWTNHLDENLVGWKPGFPGSMNSPRLANAVRCHVDYLGALSWWYRLLTLESTTHYFNGAEPCSPIYWGWSLIAEVSAYYSIRIRKLYVPVYEKVLELLRLSIRKHIGLASLTAIRHTKIRNSTNKLIYSGPAVLGPGARGIGTHTYDNRTISTCFNYALDFPDIDAHHNKDLVRQIAERLPTYYWCLDDHDYRCIKALLGLSDRPSLPAATQAIVDNMLQNCKLATPFTFMLYRNHRIAYMDRNCNGNTAPIYASKIPIDAKESSEIEYLYPYDKVRVRGDTADGKNILGVGQCGVVDSRYLGATNLTDGEVCAKKLQGLKPRQYYKSFDLPNELPIVSVKLSPHESAYCVHHS